jgi:chromosomal replication initiation ATPase DnaA
MEPVHAIVEHTATVFGRTPGELLARSRRQPIVEARQAAMWAVRQRYPSISLVDIGAAIGGRHYTTVMHALTVVELRAAHDPAYAAHLQQLLSRIRSSQHAPAAAAPVTLPCKGVWWQRAVEERYAR